MTTFLKLTTSERKGGKWVDDIEGELLRANSILSDSKETRKALGQAALNMALDPPRPTKTLVGNCKPNPASLRRRHKPLKPHHPSCEIGGYGKCTCDYWEERDRNAARATEKPQKLRYRIRGDWLEAQPDIASPAGIAEWHRVTKLTATQLKQNIALIEWFQAMKDGT